MTFRSFKWEMNDFLRIVSTDTRSTQQKAAIHHTSTRHTSQNNTLSREYCIATLLSDVWSKLDSWLANWQEVNQGGTIDQSSASIRVTSRGPLTVNQLMSPSSIEYTGFPQRAEYIALYCYCPILNCVCESGSLVAPNSFLPHRTPFSQPFASPRSFRIAFYAFIGKQSPLKLEDFDSFNSLSGDNGDWTGWGKGVTVNSPISVINHCSLLCTGYKRPNTVLIGHGKSDVWSDGRRKAYLEIPI